MKYIFIFFIISAFAFVSCSKKESSVDLSKNNSGQNDTKSSGNNVSSAGFYFVKNISTEVKKNEFIDFSWSENGQDKKLSDYKGKVILLNFWATWCGPCRHELPDLSQISKDFDGKDFVIIGVSVDQNVSALENFLRTNSLSYKIVNDRSNLLNLYMSASGKTDDVIPQTFIIDKNGKIVEAIIGTQSKADFIKIINKYL